MSESSTELTSAEKKAQALETIKATLLAMGIDYSTWDTKAQTFFDNAVGFAIDGTIWLLNAFIGKTWVTKVTEGEITISSVAKIIDSILKVGDLALFWASWWSKLKTIISAAILSVENFTTYADSLLESVTTTDDTADTTESDADTAESTADTTESDADTTESTADTTESTADTTENTADTTESTADTAADTVKSTALESIITTDGTTKSIAKSTNTSKSSTESVGKMRMSN